MKKRTFLAATSLILSPWSFLRAQVSFPERPIRLVVPFAPGGDGDIICLGVGVCAVGLR